MTYMFILKCALKLVEEIIEKGVHAMFKRRKYATTPTVLKYTPICF